MAILLILATVSNKVLQWYFIGVYWNNKVVQCSRNMLIFPLLNSKTLNFTFHVTDFCNFTGHTIWWEDCHCEAIIGSISTREESICYWNLYHICCATSQSCELYGCCFEGHRCLLVYEYLEKRSLDQALFGMNILYTHTTPSMLPIKLEFIQLLEI